MRFPAKTEKGQSLVEFALVLPIILLIVFGIAEFGRIMLVYSEVNNASREAARYGASVGTGASGTVNYLDCNGMREAALSRAVFSGLTADSIEIAFEEPAVRSFVKYADCDNPPASADQVALGDRIVITVTHTVTPMLGILPIPPLTASLTTSRTILKGLPIGPPECRDGADNDQDGAIDYPADSGCSSADDTIEAVCYRLQAVPVPPDGGAVQIAPGPNCGNLYIEQTAIELEAEVDPHYEFDYWSGPVSGTAITATFPITQDETVYANFRLLEADLAVDKNDVQDIVLPGAEVEYTIDVWNNGPDPANNVVVTDTLPAEVAFVGATIPNGSCSHSGESLGGVVVCQFSNTFPPDGSIARVTIRATAPAFTTVITNTASIIGFESDPFTSTNNLDVETTDIHPIIDAGVTVDNNLEPPDTVERSDIINHTVLVSNAGPSAATGVVVTMPVPAGASFAAFDAALCSLSGGVLECNLGSVAAGGSRSFNISLQPEIYVGTITLAASVAANESIYDENGGNDSASDTTTIDTDCWTVAITEVPNAGGDVTTSVPDEAMRCQPGANVFYDGADVTLTATAAPDYVFDRWEGVDAAAGNSASLFIDNSNEAVTAYFDQADVSLAMDVDPDPVYVGDTFNYTLTVTNYGTMASTSASLTDELPAEVSFVGASTSYGGSCTHSGGIVSCTIASSSNPLPIGGTRTVVISVKANMATDPGSLPNWARVVAINDPVPSNNETERFKRILPATADMALGPEFDVAPDVIAVGAPFTYTMVVTNSGPSTATDVEIVMAQPANTQLTSGGGAACNSSTGIITCLVGTMGEGETRTVSLVLTANISGTFTVNAEVSAAEIDPDLTNNSGTGTATVGSSEVGGAYLPSNRQRHQYRAYV